MDIWDKVFRSEPSKIFRRQIWRPYQTRCRPYIRLYADKYVDHICLSRPYTFKCFKGCLPQILIGPHLNTLSYMRRFARFGTICTILKTWKSPMEECYFFHIFKIVQMLPNPAKRYIWKLNEEKFFDFRPYCFSSKVLLNFEQVSLAAKL